MTIEDDGHEVAVVLVWDTEHVTFVALFDFIHDYVISLKFNLVLSGVIKQAVLLNLATVDALIDAEANGVLRVVGDDNVNDIQVVGCHIVVIAQVSE